MITTVKTKEKRFPNAIDCTNDSLMVKENLRPPLRNNEKKIKMSDSDKAELATAKNRYNKEIKILPNNK